MSDPHSNNEPAPDHQASNPSGTDERVGELTARIAEIEDLRLRALADLDNLRKRCAAQVRNAEAEAAARVAAQWLPVVDNLDRALAHAQADPGSIIEGVRAVRDQAVGVLAQLGYPRREDVGTAFDPARHEAIATRSDTEAPEGLVVEVIRPAYGEDVRQLRPAQVVVAKAD
jgi:molecular chaperone GrpE